MTGFPEKLSLLPFKPYRDVNKHVVVHSKTRFAARPGGIRCKVRQLSDSSAKFDSCLTLQIAPPSGESCFRKNNYMFIGFAELEFANFAGTNDHLYGSKSMKLRQSFSLKKGCRLYPCGAILRQNLERYGP
jgi:hypothetical protein